MTDLPTNDPPVYSQGNRPNQRDILPLGVKNRNVDTITWNKGFGGTLQLGGFNNQNGLLTVFDQNNTEKVRIDNTGILVTDGKITVKDANNSTIIDSLGLVSTVNFPAASVGQSLSFSTTSMTFVDVTGMTLSFTIPRTSHILFGANVTGLSPDSSDTNIVVPISIIALDGTQIGGNMTTPSIEVTAGKYATSDSLTTIETVTAGSHTVKIQLESSSGGEVKLLGLQNLYYLILGS